MVMGKLPIGKRSTLLGLFFVVLAGLLVSRGDHWPAASSRSAFRDFPRVTFWAWERHEDLRTLDPHRYAVAYLDQTVYIEENIRSRPRMQPLLVAPGTRMTAVARIEAPSQSADTARPGLVADVADLLERSFLRPDVVAFQIDFDAVESQRLFYAALIREVRHRMPPEMPLSITALASWCGSESWLSGLPVDEAVPMFFRMGRDAPAINGPGWHYLIRELLCRSSAGVSTDEPWPSLESGLRIYVFHPRPWTPVAITNVQRMITP
jgi:hypothetical protein